MAVSDTAVRHARATGNAYSLSDADGLSLYVSSGGSKIWHFRYYWFGKQQRMSLGSYPQIGLKEARALRDEARALVSDGINPCDQRREQKRAAKLMADYTFASVYAQWLAFRSLELKEGRQSTLSQIRRIFKKDILPYLGDRSIYGITRHDLLDVLSRVESRDALTTAEKCRTWLNQLFRYALVRVPGLEINPAFDLDVVAIPQPPVEHNPFLEMPELSALLPSIRAYGGAPSTVMGLFLLLLTGVRTGGASLGDTGSVRSEEAVVDYSAGSGQAAATAYAQVPAEVRHYPAIHHSAVAPSGGDCAHDAESVASWATLPFFSSFQAGGAYQGKHA